MDITFTLIIFIQLVILKAYVFCYFAITMSTSFNPSDPYGVGNVTAAAAQIPTMVALPASLILNATMLGLYIVAFCWMFFGVKRNVDSVATSPWWAFIIV